MCDNISIVDKSPSQEEIDSLAAVLMPEIVAFYKSERGQKMWEDYLDRSNSEKI